MSDNGWNGFVNIALEREHKAAVKALAAKFHDEDVFTKIVEYLDDGYRISFSPDDKNSAIVVTMTGKEGSKNVGFSVSFRHADPIIAFCCLVFAHEELAQRDNWRNVGQTQLGFNW